MFESIFGKNKEQEIQAAQAKETHERQIEEGAAGSAHALQEYAQKYDQEWVRFLAVLSENEGVKDIVDFIENTSWTDRQKTKIMSFSKIALGKNIGTTFITGQRDYISAIDEFVLAEVNLILGLTVFDITPEYNLLIDLIKQNFLISLRRSKGALFLERIGTSRVEFSKDSVGRDENGYRNQRKPGMLG